MSIDLSIVLITLNEEQNIKRCLESCPSGAEIIVLDSGSSDGTVELAKSLGAQVYHRAFTDYSEQKNVALTYATRKWVLSLDADEVLDSALAQSIKEIVGEKSSNGYCGFRIRRQLVFMNRRLRYGRTVDFPLRLFLKDEVCFEGSIHEKARVNGPTGTLFSGSLTHYSYANLSDYFSRFNNYTSKIAANHFRNGVKVSRSRLILRPWYTFVDRYIFRLGFLDGYPGYCFALLSCFYAFVKYAKLYEILSDRRK